MVETKYGHLPYTRERFEYFDLAGHLRISSPSLIGWFRAHVHQSRTSRRIPRRFSADLHRLEYKTWIVRPKLEKYKVDGWQECLRSLNTGSGLECPDRFKSDADKGDNIGIYALPRCVCLHRGWAAA
jgi:hypothetical protein